MILLFALTMADFLLTYIGISLGIVQEMNPLHAWSFTLPFWQSFGVRVVVALLIVLPFYILYGMNRKVYKKAIAAAYIINFAVLAVHLHWMFLYLKQAGTVLDLPKFS